MHLTKKKVKEVEPFHPYGGCPNKEYLFILKKNNIHFKRLYKKE